MHPAINKSARQHFVQTFPRFLAEFILSAAEGLGMTWDGAGAPDAIAPVIPAKLAPHSMRGRESRSIPRCRAPQSGCACSIAL